MEEDDENEIDEEIVDDESDVEDESEEMPPGEQVEDYTVEDTPIDEKDIEKVLSGPSYIQEFHPQEKAVNYEEVLALCTVQKGKDPRHTTVPFVTKYEYARVIGMRASQLEHGADPFVETELTDSYQIAKLEMHAKKIPFIVKRPLPNGNMEYWKLSDLELLF